MDLKELTYLVVLAEERSVSKAAERLFMAQSSLSQFLQQTERELGARLFVRTARGIRPTPGGELFIGRLRRILADYERARGELLESENLLGGRVTLGISSFRGRRYLPPILSAFRERCPGVSVAIVEANSMKLEEHLLSGLTDLAVIALPPVKLRSGAAFLTRDEVYIVAACDHPVTAHAKKRADGRPYVELSDAARYEFILSDYDTILGNLSRRLFREARLTCRATNENISADMAVSMATHGLGLAFTYASHAEPEENAVFLSIGEAGVSLDLGLAYPPGARRSKAAQALEAVIREVYAREGGA